MLVQLLVGGVAAIGVAGQVLLAPRPEVPAHPQGRAGAAESANPRLRAAPSPAPSATPTAASSSTPDGVFRVLSRDGWEDWEALAADAAGPR